MKPARVARPWWKKRRTRWVVLCIVGVAGPVICPMVKWGPLRVACDIASQVAAVAMSVQLGPVAPMPADEFEADAGR